MNMDDDRYPTFTPLETHSKKFEMIMIGLSIACIIIVLAIILATDIGTEFRPKTPATRGEVAFWLFRLASVAEAWSSTPPDTVQF